MSIKNLINIQALFYSPCLSSCSSGLARGQDPQLANCHIGDHRLKNQDQPSDDNGRRTRGPITFKLGRQLACKKTGPRAKFRLNRRHGSRAIRRNANSFGTRAFENAWPHRSQTRSKDGEYQGAASLQISAPSEQRFGRNERRNTAPIHFRRLRARARAIFNQRYLGSQTS